jgi:hypothetical protein
MATSRERKALLTLFRGPIVPVPGTKNSWIVKGRKKKDGKEFDPYLVKYINEIWDCSCKAGQDGLGCKHVGAVKIMLEKGNPETLPSLDETKRPTYPQDNVLQRIVRETMAQAQVPVLLALARKIYPIGYLRQMQTKAGGPRCELSDTIVCICLRTFHGVCGENAQGYVRNLFAEGLLHHRHLVDARPPSEPAISLAMRRKDVNEAFRNLIDRTNAPFEGMKELVILDGSEYSTPLLRRISNVERTPSTHERGLSWLSFPGSWDKTVKLHAAVGADSGLFLAAEITAGKTGDSTKAIELIEHARALRFVKQVAADKAYVGEDIMSYLELHGIQGLIPAKSNSVKDEETAFGRHVTTWRQNARGEHRDYGRRVLVEAQFSRDKRLNGDWLTSKTMEALATELLSHVLVQNVRTLIAKYIAGEIDLPFLDERSKAILDPARAAANGRPMVDRSPKFRDGLDKTAA